METYKQGSFIEPTPEPEKNSSGGKRKLALILAAVLLLAGCAAFLILHWPRHYNQDCYLSVEVRNVETNEVIPNAKVTVTCTSARKADPVTADYWEEEANYYTIISGGQYRINVTCDGYEDLEVLIAVQEQEVFRVSTALIPK